MFKTVLRYIKNHWALIIGVSIILAAFVSESQLKKESSLEIQGQIIRSTLYDRVVSVESALNRVSLEDTGETLIDRTVDSLSSILDENTSLLIYDNNQLSYWSNSSVAFSQDSEWISGKEGILKLKNGWYWVESLTLDLREIFVLTLIKTEFLYKNRYLPREFSSLFPVYDNIDINLDSGHGIPIEFPDGRVPFYISEDTNSPKIALKDSIIVLLYVLGFIFVVLYSVSRMKRIRWKNDLTPLIFVSTLFALFFTLIEREYLFSLALDLPLFSPFYLSTTLVATSIGELCLFSMFIVSLLSVASSCLRRVTFLRERGLSEVIRGVHIVIPLLIVASFTLFVILIEEVVMNSNLNLRFSGEGDISMFDILALLALVTIHMSSTMLLISYRIYIGNNRREKLIAGVILSVLISITLSVILYIYDRDILLPFLCFAVQMIILNRMSGERYRKAKLYIVIGMAICGTLNMSVLFDRSFEERIEGQQELMAEILTSERDPIAEMLLVGVEDDIHVYQISMDDTPSLTDQEYEQSLNDYILDLFSDGYWSNYTAYITVCSKEDKIIVDRDDEREVNCNDFFREMMITDGIVVPKSEFYYLERIDQGVSYIAELTVGRGYSLFIEVVSNVVSEGIGYPDLLLDESINRSRITQNFSLAKYSNSKIVYRKGEYEFPHFANSYNMSDYDSRLFEKWGYKHLAKRIEGDNLVVVSRKVVTLREKLAGIPYLLLSFLLIGLLVNSRLLILFANREGRKGLRLKINRSLTIIITVLVLVNLIGLIWYSYSRLEKQNRDDLEDKVRAVSTAVELDIGKELYLDQEKLLFIQDKLISLSEIFRLDINIYGLDGIVMVTSRPEIIESGLMGVSMSPDVSSHLGFYTSELFVHKEMIGNLSYSSIYFPLHNKNYVLLGYVNIPYFVSEDVIQEELSTFIVTIINLFIIIILITFVVTLSISRRITEPLLVLERGLRTVTLDRKNEKIDIKGEDEIGRLIELYNKQVDSLAESAKKLAKSERQSAWSEMARQVAHEIKNPLTPMKLSLQYLIRLKGDGETFDRYFDKVTTSLIEQIDSLSSIASSFSNFAKIERVEIEPVNPTSSIESIRSILVSEGALKIDNRLPDRDRMMGCNREHLSRIIINLVKNGRQAAVTNRDTNIVITLTEERDRCLIAIADNGKGISKEIEKRLFEPYFTTKSSGTGLGLAIIAKLIESANGEITYKTEVGVGTTFYVSLPWWKEQ